MFAIAVAGGKVYAGGTFTNAGTGGADNLAVWDGTGWKPFCTPPATTIGNVKALQIVGSTLYVGGDFQDGAGIATADYLLACDLATGQPSATTIDPAHPFSGPVKALTATSDGTLYAGGRFVNLENIDAADDVAYLPQGGTWHPMGSSGGGPFCGCALDAYVRALATNGTDVFVGTEGSDVAGIAQADHVAKWNGSAWSALGSNTGGTDGWFPTGDQHLWPRQPRLEGVRDRDVPERERRRARRQRGVVRRHGLARARVQRRRQRSVGRRGLGPRARRPAGSMRRGTSRAPAVTPRRSPPPRSRSRR